MSHPCTIDIRPSAFRKGAKDAVKRHRSFEAELASILGEIEKDAFALGDQVPNCGRDIHVRKIRIGAPGDNVKPPDGYRLLIQIIETDGKIIGRCLSLYYKKDTENKTFAEIKELIRKADSASVE